MKTMLWPILRTALRNPSRLAIVDDQRRWRYIDLLGGAFHLAEKIEAISHQRRVGILLPTSGAFPMALLAIWLLRRVPVPVNFLLQARERQFIIDHSEIDTLITAGPMLEHLGEAPSGVRLLKLDEMTFTGAPPLRWPPIAAADEPAVILYTSGTSGRPKGVVLTHGNLSSNVRAAIQHVRLTTSDGFIGVLPQFHSFGLTALTLVPLSGGALVIYTARFQPLKLVKLIRQYKPDIFLGIPSMYNALLGVKSLGPDDLKQIKLAVSGGEPLPQVIFDRFKSQFDMHILEGYGLTETAPVVSWSVPWAWKPGSVGKVLPGIEVQIVDDADRPVPPGEEGEVLVRGPNVMAGYYRQAELTAEVLDGRGYFRTGDWGKLDEEGFLFITGRKKDMLIIGGENVFPREIEEVLNQHPTVRDSAVVGRQDYSRGEVPIAFVEIEEGATFDEAALRTWCREHLAGYKVPREIRSMVSLPRGPTGKVLRRELAGKVGPPEDRSSEQNGEVDGIDRA
jgi:long-chain acyl-CoA synthetase